MPTETWSKEKNRRKKEKIEKTRTIHQNWFLATFSWVEDKRPLRTSFEIPK